MKLSAEDLLGADRSEKAAAALARSRLVEVSTEAELDEGFAPMWAEFQPTGGIERREVLVAWLRGELGRDPAIPVRYRMLLVKDGAGALVAVRDHFLVHDLAGRHVTVLYSHSYVPPAHRRSGVAAILRAAPLADARALLGGDGTIDLVVEQDHPVVKQVVSRARLVAYGRAGFRALDPAVLPYAQPDFTEPVPGTPARPVPMLLVAMRAGEASTVPAVPVERARRIVEHLRAIHGWYVDARALATLHAHMEGALDAARVSAVPLRGLPVSPLDAARLEPLLRAGHEVRYPEAWRIGGHLGSVSAELDYLRTSEA